MSMSERYDHYITPMAMENIREILHYIASELKNLTAAINLNDAIDEAIQSLSHDPYRIKPVDEQPWHDEGIRKIRVKNYYVYFWIDEPQKMVRITGVIYVGRDQEKQLEERDMKKL